MLAVCRRAPTLAQTGCTMRDLLEFIAPLNPRKEIMAEGAPILLRGAALPLERDLLWRRHKDITATSPFRPHGHARRLHDVCSHDQLRLSRMGHGSDSGLSLRP